MVIQSDNIATAMRRIEYNPVLWRNVLDESKTLVVDKYYYVDRGPTAPSLERYVVFNSTTYCYMADVGMHSQAAATKFTFPQYNNIGECYAISLSLLDPKIQQLQIKNQIKWLIENELKMSVCEWFTVDGYSYFYVNRGDHVPDNKYFVFTSTNFYTYVDNVTDQTSAHGKVYHRIPPPKGNTLINWLREKIIVEPALSHSTQESSPWPQAAESQFGDQLHLWRAMDRLTDLAHQII